MESKCAKCGGDIHRVPQPAVEVAIAISWAKTASMDYMVCVGCGLIEMYVADKGLLPSIAEKYPR